MGLLSLLWGGGVYPAVTIAVSIALSVSISASVGASIPLILYARSLDPKVASGPVVLMFADVITTTIYSLLGNLVAFVTSQRKGAGSRKSKL